jgi:hypothetical protein
VFDRLTGLFSVPAGAVPDVMVAVILFVLTIFGSLAVVVFLLTRLPSSYFHPSYDRRHRARDRHWLVRLCSAAFRNAIGTVLVILGIVMSLPGVPGQGLLTALVGLMLVDFPGKRALEYRIIRQPRIFRAVNRLRQAFSKPPLVLE